MTYDHTIDDSGEYKRIIKEGGFISNGGLCDALKLSRCFGIGLLKIKD